MLLLLSLLGPIGSIVGMLIFHHKTKKIKFWIVNITALIIWIYLLDRGVL